jgi:L-threonylcarbamoyladenylate synthase
MSWPAARATALDLLREGACVAFPTETVYGLGARFDDEEAVQRIFIAKGRPADKPLIVHVVDETGARAVAGAWPEAAARLAAAFWPGPLTLVVPRGARVPDVVSAGGSTVALRATSHPVARALIEAVGTPLAAPSANPSGAPPPTTAAEVLAGLAGKIPLVIDGGVTPHATPSTLLDVTVVPCRVLRDGAVSRAELARHVALA